MINENYINKIQELSPNMLLLLGLCYAERNLQVVKAFDNYYCERLSDCFSSKLDYAFFSVTHELTDHVDIVNYSLELEQILPDTEDYPDILGGLALNGLSTLCYCYRYLLTNQLENIIYIINLAFETIDAIGIETNEQYDYEIECQKEFVLLDEYLEALSATQFINMDMLSAVRKMNSENMFVYIN